MILGVFVVRAIKLDSPQRHEDTKGHKGSRHMAKHFHLSVSAVLFSTFLLSACAAGPHYKRPAVQVPPQFRRLSDSGKPPASESLADLKWFDLFEDEVLKQLVTTALKENFDLRIAAERVLEARARLGIQRSQEFPTIDAGGQFSAVRPSRVGQFKLPPGASFLSDVSYTQAGFSLGWEIDVWGRL